MFRIVWFRIVSFVVPPPVASPLSPTFGAMPGNAKGVGHGRSSASRSSFFLELSQPGVFFAADVRHGSVNRVVSAVGKERWRPN
jgi:hypothetical protein